AAFGVDFFLPNLGAEQRLLACPGEPAGLRHAEADLDRLALGESARRRQCRPDQGRADTGIHAASGYPLTHDFPPESGFSFMAPVGPPMAGPDVTVSATGCPALAAVKRERGNVPDFAGADGCGQKPPCRRAKSCATRLHAGVEMSDTVGKEAGRDRTSAPGRTL